MTTLGKLLILINVALSIGMAAFALGLYANRIEWAGAKPSDSEGVINTLTTEIKNRQDLLGRSIVYWKREAAELARRETFQLQARDFYAKQLQALQTGKGPGQPVDVLVQGQGGFKPDAAGRPILEMPALQAGPATLLGRSLLEQNLRRLENEIAAEIEATKKVMDAEAALTARLNGQQGGTRGLRYLLAEMQDADKKSAEELRYVKRERINSREAASSLVHRQQQLRQRKETLERLAATVQVP
jgi:hypothetical protein